MIGRPVRILGGLLLAAAVITLAGEPPADAADKKTDNKPSARKKTDSTKRAAGTLAADAKLNATQLAAHIDKLIAKKLTDEKIAASALCTDEEFLRRATLDLTGKVPTREQAVAFLDSKETDRRAKLIDDLLASKGFGTFQADVWQASLLPRDSDNRRLMQWYPNLTTWLEKQFNDNPGWDKTVKEFITATGEVDKVGPVIYWLANNTPDKMTDSVTRTFMGIQLQCAQCHNHPFTDYKQNDYWHTAAFFLKVGPEGNPKAAAKNKTSITLSEKARPNRKKLANPDAKVLPPKFLKVATAPAVKAGEPLRPVFADWMASKDNPYFSKAMVNRVWGHFLGRGLVAPIDDMHDANPPSHPELMIDLAGQFTANDFDVKYLIRAICNSQTYQRSSKVKGNNDDAGPELFARAAIRPLTPGQLWDSLQMLTAGGQGKGGKQRPLDAKRGGGGPRQQFIASYGIEDGADPTEYQAGIPQVLRQMNAAQLNNSAMVTKLTRESKTDAEVIEKLYLTVLSRRPTTEDVERFNKYAKKSTETRDKKMASLLWALMNSSEFALNRLAKAKTQGFRTPLARTTYPNQDKYPPCCTTTPSACPAATP
jgi:hypothetical protein